MTFHRRRLNIVMIYHHMIRMYYIYYAYIYSNKYFILLKCIFCSNYCDSEPRTEATTIMAEKELWLHWKVLTIALASKVHVRFTLSPDVPTFK